MKKLRSAVGVILVLVLAAAAVAAAQQRPDRSAPPKPGPPPALKLPAIEKKALSSGLPVWFVGLRDVPVVHVSLVMRAGSSSDPAGRFGLASLTAAMLDEGAGSRSALELADAVDFLGANLSTSADWDAAFVELHAPVARLGDALPLMADVVLRPSFDAKELQRVREERVTGLLQVRDDPADLIRFAFARLVYGEKHRYGTLDVGTVASLKGVGVEDLRQFHRTRYVPSTSVLIVTGDIDPATAMPLLERAFGSWAGTTAPPVAIAEAAQLKAREIFIVDTPGAAQSPVRIGWVGVPRTTADYFALRVLNTVLGGSFTSRLNMNLREQHQYSYGARSAFDMRASAGPFYAEASVQTDKTAEAIREFFSELERIRKPIPADELERAKNYVAALLPRSFETTESVAGSLAQVFIYNLPDDYFATFTNRIRAVTAADVQRAAERYIQPDRFAVVVVGDRKVIEPGIRNLKLGNLRIVAIDEILR